MALGEFELIYRYFSSFGRGSAVELGVGDDCAIFQFEPGESIVTSVDTMVAGRHFPEYAFPEDIGYRAVAAATSDLAAMGARPLGMTLALTLPEADELWLHAFSEGVGQASRAFDLPLVGGDTTRGSLTISVQVLGAVPAGAALLRSGARPGDRVCVSGTLGDAAAGLALENGELVVEPDEAEYLSSRFHRPTPRLTLGQELLGRASSCIDISDGLLADAGHVASASGVAIRIEADSLPLSPVLLGLADRPQSLRWALAGGDDYELCFTLPGEERVPAGCCVIGAVSAGEGVSCDIPPGDGSTGFRHF
jgi:thiamine-monophosphate kinase